MSITNSKLSKKELKKLFEENGYYISDYILSKTFIALNYLMSKESVGQKVYSMCLDGPSGAGKTHFVETYCKIASKILNRKVKFINFQLDAETGKSDLYEDIDVVASFENDTSKIRIPGKIVEAIKAVNEGQIVILKMDEYDKARDATDTYFNNLLQEALINTIQHGDVAIDSSAGGCLQVFLCKNDLRAELSEPMMRRNRITRLDYMKPDRMYTILNEFATKWGCSQELVNLVSLLYENIYENRDLYTKLPSCSECQEAIMDAEILLSDADFTRSEIYINIIEDMLKMNDDIATFESLLEKKSTDKNEKLSAFVKEMKASSPDQSDDRSINDLIAGTVLKDAGSKLNKKIEEMTKLISEYRKKFADMEEARKKAITEEINKILLENGQLVSSQSHPQAISNFEDETAYIKRGHSIFETSPNDWTEVASIYMPDLNHHFLITKMMEYASRLGIVIYENGIVLRKDGEETLISIKDKDEDGKDRYRILSSHPIIPSTYLNDINTFISTCKKVYDSNAQTVTSVTNHALNLDNDVYSINTLIYNDSLLPDLDTITDNVYHLELSGKITPDLDFESKFPNISCQNPNNAVNASKKIMQGKEKVIKHE